MKKFFRIIQGFGVVIGLLVLATSGQAALFTDPLGNGTASVTAGAGTITVLLTDTAVNPTSIIENISGFVFSTNGGSGVAATAVTPTATYVTIAADGSYAFGGGPAIWSYSGTSSQYVLTWNGGIGTGPDYSIVGVPGVGNYTNANGSLAGNDPHNPFIYHTGTFVLNIAGVNADTVISNGTIKFGTDWGTTTIPEASALVLLSTGLVGLVVWRRKNRFK